MGVVPRQRWLARVSPSLTAVLMQLPDAVWLYFSYYDEDACPYYDVTYLASITSCNQLGSSGMGLIVSAADMLCRQMGVNLCRRYIGMSQ